MNKSAIISFLILLILLIFTRFFNLDLTARFTEDESKDLVGIHQIFVDKKLTLVGPTNEQGTKVFSSLTFYMLMPGAIIGNFNPISPHYSAAFWGVVTAILVVYFTQKNNPKLKYLIAVLVIIWFPLLETSRWAWNPNFIPLWIILGILTVKVSNKYSLILSGLFFGLSIHSHYYSVFAVTIFMFLMSVFFLIKKQYIYIACLGFGFFLSILPFLIFDLRHSPGIFIPNLFLQSRSVGSVLSLDSIFIKFLSNLWNLMVEYTQTIYLAVPLVVSILLLIFQDIRRKSFGLIYIIPWIFQSLTIAIVPQFFPHYLIPGLIFFIVWVIYKRSGLGKLLSYIILIVLLIGGLFSVLSQITTPTSDPNIPTAHKIEQIIKNNILSGDLKNVNIAVLASPDKNTEGKKYRDLLLVDGNIHILTKNEYNISDHLFVISKSDEKIVRLDPALEIQRFKKGRLVSVDQIDTSGWFVYHFIK
jgi:hypothetical protein